MADDRGAVNDGRTDTVIPAATDQRIREDFRRIDEMVRRSLNLRWRHLVTEDDVVAAQTTEILAIATDQFAARLAEGLNDEAIYAWMDGTP